MTILKYKTSKDTWKKKLNVKDNNPLPFKKRRSKTENI